MENRGKWRKEEEEKYVYNVKVQLSTEKDMEPTCVLVSALTEKKRYLVYFNFQSL